MKIKVSVPTSLKDIKLSQYQKFIRTTKDSEDEMFIARQMVGIFCDLPNNIVGKISKLDFNNIVNSISEILQEDGKFQPLIIHEGKQYGFIPKLEDITVDEQADIDSMINDWQKMDNVMGVMYRPVTVKNRYGYDIEDYKPAELDLTLDVVKGALGFFLTLLNDLLNCTQNYIVEEVRNPKILQTLEENGVGIKTFTNSLEATFLSLKTLVNYDYMKHCYSYHLKPTKID